MCILTGSDKHVTTVLVTGAAGYLGSVFCQMLLAAGHKVIALDSFRYGQHLSLAACCADPNFELVKGDVRDANILRPLLARADVAVPLAALVGAPLCAVCPDEAKAVNQDAVRYLVQNLSRDQLVIYPNSNSGYGSMSPGSNAPLDEDAPLNPISLYGRTKCETESAVLQHENSVVFRLATVFGASPRMRTDLLVNDFVLHSVRDRSLVLFEPHFRRNFVHVRDVAEAFCWAIEHRGQAWVRGIVFNLGHDDSNVTKMELAERIRLQVPDLSIFVSETQSDPDKRDYLVSNARLAAAGFTAHRTLDEGIAELLKLYRGFPTSVMGNV